MKIRLAVLIVLLSVIAAAQSDAAEDAVSALDARIAVLFEPWDKPDSPGAVVAVSRDGKTIYQRAFGLANLTYGLPFTPDTRVNAGSIAKHVTAVAVLTLEAEGKLSLDDEIHRYLPELPDYGAPITIRDLLQQTSGLRDYRTLMFLAGWREGDVQTNQQALQIIFRQKGLNFPTGKSFAYSNSNFVLAAEIVSRVTSQSFGAWARDHLFAPLGMNHTLVREDNAMIVPGLAASYAPSESGDGFTEDLLNSSVAGSGNLITTVDDLLIWAEHLMTAQVGGQPLLDRLEEQATLPGGVRPGYGLGVFVGSHRGLKIVHHGGETAGNRADLMIFPDQHVAIALLANSRSIRPEAAARAIADIVLADELPGPPASPEQESKLSLAFDAYMGLYKLESGSLIEIGRADGQPFVILGGTPPHPLYSLGEHQFGTGEAGVVFRFVPDEGGHIGSVVLEIAGRPDLTGHRLPPVTLSERALSKYAGAYYSDELETYYHIRPASDGLIAGQMRLRDVRLMPIGGDKFLERPGGNMVVTFRRRGGRIRGFDLSVSRAQHITFEKQ